MNRLHPKAALTRLESWASLGVPDLLICDPRGSFHMIELKYVTGYAVSLRPHQVAWMAKHSYSSSWVLVKQQKKSENKSKLFLFHARDAIQLKMEGLKSVEPAYWCEQTFDWTKVFEKIFN